MQCTGNLTLQPMSLSI